VFECGFHSRLIYINVLFFLLFIPLSSGLGEISITLGNFIDFNISLNIFLLWRGVHKGSSLGHVSVLVIIDASILWVSTSNVVFVIRIKGIEALSQVNKRTHDTFAPDDKNNVGSADPQDTSVYDDQHTYVAKAGSLVNTPPKKENVQTDVKIDEVTQGDQK
jgi:hypothetical protein